MKEIEGNTEIHIEVRDRLVTLPTESVLLHYITLSAFKHINGHLKFTAENILNSTFIKSPQKVTVTKE